MVPHVEHCPRKRSPDPTTCDIDHDKLRVKWRKAARNYPPGFWEALSIVTLTRKSLREFDRRIAQRTPTQAVVAGEKRTRSLRPNPHRLAHFAQSGGPSLSDLRGYAETSHAMPAGTRNQEPDLPSSEPEAKSGTTGPYDAHFEGLLIEQGVYPAHYTKRDGSTPPDPDNLDNIMRILGRRRPSLSSSAFSKTAFKNFQNRSNNAASESKTMSRVIPVITGDQANEHENEENIVFNNLKGFHPKLTAPKPDLYYGAHPGKIDQRVRADLGQYIIPSTDHSLPAAVNFFLEAKSKSGRSDVLQRQAMYHGAVGARAMLELQNYRNTTRVYDGNAYSGMATYHPGDGSLRLYATHPRPSASGGTEFHMTELDSYPMTGKINKCKEGIAAYRNYRDHIEHQRTRLIAKANAVAQGLPVPATPGSESGNRSNDSSAAVSRPFHSNTSVARPALDHAAVSFANSNLSEPEEHGRPHKRIARGVISSAHLRSTVNVSAYEDNENPMPADEDNDEEKMEIE